MNLRQEFHAALVVNNAIDQIEEVHRGQPVGEFLLRAEVFAHVEHHPGEMFPGIEAGGTITRVAGTAPSCRKVGVVRAKVMIVRLSVLYAFAVDVVVRTDARTYVVTPLFVV